MLGLCSLLAKSCDLQQCRPFSLMIDAKITSCVVTLWIDCMTDCVCSYGSQAVYLLVVVEPDMKFSLASHSTGDG